MPAYRQNLAISHNYLGILLLDLGKRAEAEGQFRKVLGPSAKSWPPTSPTVPAYQIDLAGSYCNHGNLVCNAGGQREPGWFDKAIATLAPVHRAEPRPRPGEAIWR